MCDPVSIMAASVAMSAASAGAGIFNQQQAQKAERRNFDFVKRQASLDANATYSQLARRQEQENVAASQAVQENLDRSISASSSARVAAAAAGASGASVAALMRDYEMSRMGYAQRVSRQRMLSEAEYKQANKGVQAQYSERVYSASPKLPGPDYLGAALQIGQTAIQGYYNATTYDPAKGKRVFQ